MAAKQDPVSGLNYGWALGEDDWNVGMDSNLIKLGANINITVLDFAATPSVSTNGTRYIVASGSGAFAGQNNKLAVRVEDVWTFYTLPEGCIVYDEDTNKHYKFEGGSYSLLVGSYIREGVTFTSGSIVTNTSVSGTVSISPRYQLLQITTNHPCRVRLYTSTAKRDADLTRSIGTDPQGNHGLMFEFISTADLLSADLSPLVDGFADTAAIPYSITNLSGATQTITVTLNHVKTGA